ncbi:hypothetical protein ACFLS1_10935 [Verrucomicrobiota bacterium]
MDINKTDSKTFESDANDHPFARPNSEALPKVLDPAVTMAVVQRYIESERGRNRRTLLWMSSIFLFVAVTILLLFVSISIFMVKNSRRSFVEIEKIKDETISDVVNISGKMSMLENNHGKISDVVKSRQVRQEKQEKLFKSDLEKFAEWVMLSNSRKAETLSAMGKRVKELESKIAEDEKKFAKIKNQYETLLDTIHNLPAREPVTRNDAEPPDNDMDTAPLFNVPEFDINDEPMLSETNLLDVPRPKPNGEISVVAFPNGDRYEGEFSGGFFNGWGIYYYSNGDRYEGDFKNDMKHGQGAFYSNNGDRYSGGYKNDMKNGRGSFQFYNKDRYIGDFKDDRINGKGTMLYRNGNKYAGDFRNGLRHGNGVLYFSNGDIYQGDFKDDLREGKGTYIYTDGAKYIGQHKEGKRNGKGRYVYASGEEYIGEYKEGKKHGQGTCVYPNGLRRKGLWKDDKFVKEVDE